MPISQHTNFQAPMAIVPSCISVLRNRFQNTGRPGLIGLFILLWTLPGLFPMALAEELGSSCEILDQGKWNWRPLFGDYLPPFWQKKPDIPTQVSLISCWNCGLWVEESFPPSWNPEDLRQTLAFERAKCYQALGMQAEALGSYRGIIRQYPSGKPVARCLQSIMEIQFQDGNYEAVIDQYQGLDPSKKSLLSPDSLYLVAQSLYQKNNDKQGRELLEQIPPNSDIYPFALYALAQVAFRNGEQDQALVIIGSLLDQPMDVPVPVMLRELARLSRARIFFQQENYPRAIEEYRKLNRSRFFLPDALMGMGWCYEAMGEPARAISYFQAVGEASMADSHTWARANLEIAHLYSETGIHNEAFLIFQEVQHHLKSLVDQHRKVLHDEAWLSGLSDHLLTSHGTNPPASTPPRKTIRTAELRNEMQLLLEKESYTSPRMKMLLEVREALEEVNALLTRVPDRSDQGTKERLGTPFQYPPLERSSPILEPELTLLLDASFALLDTEYRLDNTGRMLSLTGTEAQEGPRKQRLAFYRSALQEMLLPRQAGQDAYATLRRLQSVVRHLPFPLEVRREVLAKLLYARRTLEETDQTLQRWETGMEAIRSDNVEPPRLLLLKEWMIYVRTLILFRSWSERSPAVFLLEIGQEPQPEASHESPMDSVRIKLTERKKEIQNRLASLLQGEIEKVHERRLKNIEEIFMKSQLYYAEALLHKQETLLKSLQSTPAD